ncbi:MAG: Hpt domain [Acidimicrobiales bacterium]|nr:Hpt domain [Acidimicrobiales bacterium]
MSGDGARHPRPLGPAPEVLNQRMVSALRAIGPEPGELLRAMVHDFLVQAPALTTDIERAAERGDATDAARAAHRLRGTSGHLGLARLSAVAAEVEAAAMAGAAWVVSATRVRPELDIAIGAARAVTAVHLEA